MPLTVRNTAGNVAVFASAETGRTIIFKQAGDPMGGDIQRCPNAFAEDIDFLNALDQGILVVDQADDPEIFERLQRSSTQYQDRQQQAALRQAEVLDRRQDRDLVTTPCIGPHPNGRGVEECGAPVLQRNANKNDEPPLCPKHVSLAPQFYLVEQGSKGEGATESREGQVRKTWKRVQVTAPVRGSR